MPVRSRHIPGTKPVTTYKDVYTTSFKLEVDNVQERAQLKDPNKEFNY